MLPEKSTDDIRMMPANDARTPISFLAVKCSTLIKAPKTRVQMPILWYVSQGNIKFQFNLLLVDISMVELATVVYSRQAAMK